MRGTGGTVLGVDLGGTSAKVIVVEPSGDPDRPPRLLERRVVDTTEGRDGLDVLFTDVRPMVAAHGVDRVGVAVAGVVDEATGVIHRSTNLPWLDGMPLGERVESALGVPARVVHDVRSAALAEVAFGAGCGHDDVFVIAVGTGIAGAHIVNGRVRKGAHGAAGEIGHVVLHASGPLCACGQRGCLETYASGAWLLRRWRQVEPRATATVADLADRARQGDPGAVSVVHNAQRALAAAVLKVSAMCDPGLVIIGGGLSISADLFVEPVAALAREAATFHRMPEVRPAALGQLAGAWGATVAAMESVSLTG